MIRYSMHHVYPCLRRFVRHYTVTQCTSTFTSVLAAKTDASLIFQFGVPKQQGLSCGFEFKKTLLKNHFFHRHQIWLNGMHTQPLYYQLNTNTNFLWVNLTPIGIYHLLRDSIATLVNQGCPFNLHSKQFDHLVERLQDVEHSFQAVELVEKALLDYYNSLKMPISLQDVSPVCDYIVRQKGMVKIKHLEEKFKGSSRWLEKQFEKQIGLSPKDFTQLTRFRCLLTRRINHPKLSWAELMDEYGYYDQSHLIQAFRAYTGFTPTQYMNDVSLNLNNVHFEVE
ncbi:MAG: hypothetical protein RL329_3711 [Bacteroidota bacterium]|jgi:AraC-like DNA-binding protein